jgi:hypothetical protein
MADNSSSEIRPRHPAMALPAPQLDEAHASCTMVDAATRTELRGLARGRILLIDFFCVVGRRGTVLGDVTLRWLPAPDELPRGVARVDDVSEVPVFIMPELAPLMVAVGGRLTIAGPRWAPFLRHPVITSPTASRGSTSSRCELPGSGVGPDARGANGNVALALPIIHRGSTNLTDRSPPWAGVPRGGSATSSVLRSSYA